MSQKFSPLTSRARAWGLFGVLAATAFVAGCSSEASKPKDAAAPKEPAKPIEVTVVDKAGFAQAIAAHAGKIVLVDYWATWCPPCVRQFPHTVELAHKYRDRGLDVVGLSFDEPANVDEVKKFLTEKGANFENLISKVGSDETSAAEFEFDGALPHYVLYDRTGKLVKRLSPADTTTAFRPELIDAAIEELLAAPAAR